jgi:hypothetical protein
MDTFFPSALDDSDTITLSFEEFAGDSNSNQTWNSEEGRPPNVLEGWEPSAAGVSGIANPNQHP